MSFIQTYQARFDAYLKNFFDSFTDQSRLTKAMQYACLNGGKRLRPLLVYAAGLDFGAEEAALDKLALAVEFIHCYSLIHDDLPAMDNDDFRRGQPSCHKAFDEATAILAGDALQALAFEMLTKASLPTGRLQLMLQHFTRACGFLGMAGGQALDLEAKLPHITIEQIKKIHYLKTAALIQVSILLGAYASTTEIPQRINELAQLGEELGLAFQIQDDVYDYEEDRLTHKLNYAVLVGKDVASHYYNQLYSDIKQHLQQLPAKNHFLSEVISWLQQRLS